MMCQGKATLGGRKDEGGRAMGFKKESAHSVEVDSRGFQESCIWQQARGKPQDDLA